MDRSVEEVGQQNVRMKLLDTQSDDGILKAPPLSSTFACLTNYTRHGPQPRHLRRKRRVQPAQRYSRVDRPRPILVQSSAIPISLSPCAAIGTSHMDPLVKVLVLKWPNKETGAEKAPHTRATVCLSPSRKEKTRHKQTNFHMSKEQNVIRDPR